MHEVDIIFLKELRVCRCKVRHRYRLALRNVQLLGENLRESVNEERLPGSLLMDSCDNLWHEGLPDFVRILSKQFPHLFNHEVRQMELILDIERRDRPIVVELCNTLDPDDANAVRASRLTGNVDMAERMKKIAHGDLRDAIKLVNDEDNLLPIIFTIQKTR